MPYTPPGGDKQHAAQLQLRREDLWIEQQHKPKSRILDTRFYGDRSPVFVGYTESRSYPIADTQCKRVVYENND